MQYKFIETYSDFILNETLKTIEINKTIESISNEFSLMKLNFNIIKNNNKIELDMIPIKDNIKSFEKQLNYIISIFSDRFGWFPSIIEMKNYRNMIKKSKYNKHYLLNSYKSIYSYKIIFEPKLDEEECIDDELYHLSIQQYNSKIIKNGLCLKSKSKLTKHLDRIYVCKDVEKCYKLIPNMKFNCDIIKIDNNKNTIDDRWIIYKIDTENLNIKLYKDPNYDGGYYIVDNIHTDRLEIYDKE
jgi:hypothetical protein